MRQIFTVLLIAPALYTRVLAQEDADATDAASDNSELVCDEGSTDNSCVTDASEEEVLNELTESVASDALIQEVISNINTVAVALTQSEGEGHSLGNAGFNLPPDCIEAYDSTGTDDETNAKRQQCRSDATGDDEEKQQQFDQLTSQQDMLKRFVELKQLVAWMQPKDKRMSRYCFYGCWCLPEGAHSFVAGEGRPVDLVDKACQNLWFCYVCARYDFKGVFSGKQKECVPDKRRYSFKFKYDALHKHHYDKRDIVCKDAWSNPMDTKTKQRSNCARAICECDRGLAIRLYKVWKHWDKSRHRIWSQKVETCKQLDDCHALPEVTDKEKDEKRACIKRGCLFIVKRRCLNGLGDGEVDHELICCGLYGDEGSRMEMRDHGGTHACCNHDEGTGTGLPWNGNWYNTFTHCCLNGVNTATTSGLCP